MNKLRNFHIVDNKSGNVMATYLDSVYSVPYCKGGKGIKVDDRIYERCHVRPLSSTWISKELSRYETLIKELNKYPYDPTTSLTRRSYNLMIEHLRDALVVSQNH